MATAQELSDRLGLPLRAGVERPAGFDEWPEKLEVAFFKKDDPAYTRVGPDGERIPIGQAVEELRKELNKTDGAHIGPYGTVHLIRIPAKIRNGEGYYVSLSFTKVKPGHSFG